MNATQKYEPWDLDAMKDGCPTYQDALKVLRELEKGSQTEAAMTAVIKFWLKMGVLHSVLQLPAIARYCFEFALDGSRLDLVLFHADRSATLIELKGETTVRGIVPGIGQLLVYGIKFRRASSKWAPSHRPTGFRLLLAAPAAFDAEADISEACTEAGCGFFIMPGFESIRESLRLRPSKR